MHVARGAGASRGCRFLPAHGPVGSWGIHRAPICPRGRELAVKRAGPARVDGAMACPPCMLFDSLALRRPGWRLPVASFRCAAREGRRGSTRHRRLPTGTGR
ncbi:hypothetical protein J2792_002435 [Novosphingobium capsulatum]|uniref:Uncharacterized protein n=2 Tax=Novosphingobium capsulatum TaxID=13688 RepID=A0ABU1MMI6_9SPHN|nr:hypothetical protein [Novosphingobium capsulatum]